MMTKNKARKVYDILVQLGRANQSNREGFIFHHTESNSECTEWRFQGAFGFGGKYWRDSNKITCYPEDETPELIELMDKINFKLSEIDKKL